MIYNGSAKSSGGLMLPNFRPLVSWQKVTTFRDRCRQPELLAIVVNRFFYSTELKESTEL
jgi:hypothetical protein